MDENEWKIATSDRCTECNTELPISVCRSGAGYYIGKDCPIDGPFSRLSAYFGSEHEAQTALVEWHRMQAAGEDLRGASGARVIGYVPGPMTINRWGVAYE